MTGPQPRVRFAPSPTGYFHVGSARTSLFNWLFARQQGGTFILRIEDTDAERSRPEWVSGILSAMAWLGMEPDEGPFFQSARADRHREAIDALWNGGFLYACDCTREAVIERTRNNAVPGYDGFCRDRGLERGPGRALRFRVPDEGTTVVHDLVRGDVEFPNASMEDFVCAKSNGQPLFVFANVVDDRDSAITHVIRGEDLLPSTPKGILLWHALDSVADGGIRALPRFAHLPMLVNERRQKLSKRRDPVALELYRDAGYLAVAMRNYLALLGWSPPGDQEKVDVEVLISTFRLEDVHHAPAFFDVQKLRHLNGEYIRELSLDAFVEASLPWVAPDQGAPSIAAPQAAIAPRETTSSGPTPPPGAAAPTAWRPPTDPPWPRERFDPAAFRRIAPAVQERVTTLGEVPAMIDFLFLVDPIIDPVSWEKVVADPNARSVLSAAAERYAACEWVAAVLHDETRALGDQLGLKLNKAQAPIRVAITGRGVGPPLFESLEVLGRDVTLQRIRQALDRLSSSSGTL